MRILTGDECGLLKEFVPKIAQQQREKTASSKKSDIILPVHYDRMQNINNQYGIRRIDNGQEQTRVKGVVDMTTIGSGSGESLEFATLRADGSVELWKSSGTSQYERVTTATDDSSDMEMDIFESVKYNNNPIPTVPVKPLAIEALASNNKKLVACDTHGNLVILKTSHGNNSQISAVENFCAYDNNPDNTTLTYTKGKVMNQQLATCMAVMPDASTARVAIGGRERDVRLLDLGAGGKCLWKAKNLPPDPQTLLQQPIWVSTMTCLTGNQNLLAVGTGLGQVRIYDVRDSSTTRRPVMYTPSSKEGHRITALASISDNQIVTGDTTGDLHSMDLRYHFINNLTKTGTSPQQYCHPSSTGRYIGPAGSIQQLIKHPTKPILACVGYDRILRTYNTQTHKVIDCVYLKQRLNCALLIPDQDDDEEDNDMEKVASTMNEEDIANQEDVVEDYIDSDDENEYEDQQETTTKKSNMKEPAAAAAAIVEHSSSDEDDDDSNDNEEEEEEQSGDSNNSSSSSEASDDDEEDEQQEEEAPRKRRKR